MVSEAVATQVQPILVEMRQMFADRNDGSTRWSSGSMRWSNGSTRWSSGSTRRNANWTP